MEVDVLTHILNTLSVSSCTMYTVCACVLQELNELVQTLLNYRETIKGTKPNDEIFIETSDTSSDLLRSFQFTLQVILFSCMP